MDGVVSGIYIEIENFLNTNAVEIGGGLAAVLAVGAEDTLLALYPWLLAILAILAAFLNSLRSDGGTLGQALNNLRGSLLSNPDRNARAAGILVWRAIASEVWDSQQSPKTYTAISYAVRDGHNYTDVSCTVNARSLEVFFDAADPNLLAFVDRLLQFEIDQEWSAGASFAGYISLRFVQASKGLIAPQQFANTVAVECSGLGGGFAAHANLGFDLGRPTIQRILAEHGIEPAPPQGKTIPWKILLLKAHWGTVAAADFFSVEVLTKNQALSLPHVRGGDDRLP